MSTVFRSAEEVSDIQKSSASLSSVMYHSSFAFSTIKPHWSSVSGVVLRGSPNCNPNPLVPGLCMCWYLLNCFSLTAQLAKNPPAIWEAPVQFLGWKDSPGEGIGDPLQCSWASFVPQLVKNPPAVWETWVQYLGWKAPLEKGKATHSSILAWRIPWTVHGILHTGVGSLSLLQGIFPTQGSNPGLPH